MDVARFEKMRCVQGARAAHISVSAPLIAIPASIGYNDNAVFTAGVAKNPAAVKLLEERLDLKLLVPEQPDIVGALGAALYGD